jgi:hypothetical protein
MMTPAITLVLRGVDGAVGLFLVRAIPECFRFPVLRLLRLWGNVHSPSRHQRLKYLAVFPGQFIERLIRQPKDRPIVERTRAEALVKLDRRFIPIKHGPLHARAPARPRHLRQVSEHRPPEASATHLRPDVEVFQVEAGATDESRKVMEKESASSVTTTLCDNRSYSASSLMKERINGTSCGPVSSILKFGIAARMLTGSGLQKNPARYAPLSFVNEAVHHRRHRGTQRFEISDSEFEIAFLCVSVVNCFMPYIHLKFAPSLQTASRRP